MLESGNISSPKLVPLCIFSILLRYTDIDRPLKQQEIIKKMELEYGYTIDRKTVGRIITALKEELDLDIESKKGGGVYLAERDFEDYEIQFLIDIVSSNPFISAADSKELRSKLSNMAGAGYRIRQRKNVIVLDAAEKIISRELYFNLDVINAAIDDNQNISFQYQVQFGVDPSWSGELVKTPVCIVMLRQRYYMLCHSLNSDEQLKYYELDKMKCVAAVEKQTKGMPEKLTTVEKDKIRKMLASGVPSNPFVLERIEFFSSGFVIEDVQNTFGDETIIIENSKYDDLPSILALTYRVSVRTNRLVFKQFYYRYMEHIKIISPTDFAQEVRAQLQAASDLSSAHMPEPQIADRDLNIIDNLSLKTRIALRRPIYLGKFQHDENRIEPVEWQYIRLTDSSGTSAVLISRYSLEFMSSDSMLWESSSVRKWLNGEFLKDTFTSEELNLLVKDGYGDLVSVLDFKDLYAANYINNLNNISMTPYADKKWKAYVSDSYRNKETAIDTLQYREKIQLSRLFWGKLPSEQDRSVLELGAFEEGAKRRSSRFEKYKLCVRPVIIVKL